MSKAKESDTIRVELSVPKDMLGADLQQVRLALGQQALEQALDALKDSEGGRRG